MIVAKRKLITAPYVLIMRERRILRPRFSLPGLAPLPQADIPVVPGSSNFLSAGVFSFTIPAYNTINFTVNGAGGGGAGAWARGGTFIAGGNGSAGGAGGLSRMTGGGFDLIGFGGSGGNPGIYTGQPFSGIYTGVDGSAGAFGSASGGTTNAPGNGHAGGVAGITSNSLFGTAQFGGAGGVGGFSARSVAFPVIPYFTVVTVTVGNGGAAGANATSQYDSTSQFPTAGAVGSVLISWS